MFKNSQSKLNNQANSNASKQLFTPLNQKEQQAITGGWSSRSSGSSGGSFW